MTKGGSKKMKIKVKTETGEVIEVVDENNKKATKVDPAEIQQIYQSQNGFKFVGLILHAESNPRCVYYVYGGDVYRLCY